MYNCYYKMGLTEPSSLTIQNEDDQTIHTYDLKGSDYATQIKQIAALIKDYDISTIYVSNKYATSFEDNLNELLLKEYNIKPTHHIDFIYRKV